MRHRSPQHDLTLVRAFQTVAALSAAGLDPIPMSYAHAHAYLAEALSTVWGVNAVSGEILKREGLPFFPTLQSSIDELVWIGVLSVESFEYVQDSRGRWQAAATCRVVTEVSRPVEECLRDFQDEVVRSNFYLEIALGIARNEPLESLFLSDASYSDPRISANRLIDLERDGTNLSSAVAERFDQLFDDGRTLSPGQKVGLYLNHLARVGGA